MPIDAIGLALLVLWVGALQLMLDKGKELDWFHSPRSSRWRVVAVVGFAFFLIWELTDKHPVVDLSLFKRRNFWSGALATAVAYGLFFGNVVMLPLWLQQYMGYTATAGRHDHGAGGPAGDRVLADRRARRSARSIRAATRPSPSWCSRWCCGCARTSTPRPTSRPS